MKIMIRIKIDCLEVKKEMKGKKIFGKKWEKIIK